jgi:hypothetical protein
MKMKLMKSVFCAFLAGGTLSLAPLANATVVDLTNDTVGTSGTINGATFQIVAPQPTGTGVIDPFLTIQNSPVEQGYNSGTNNNFDTKRVPQWNHEIHVGDLATVMHNGIACAEFIVDINEPNGGTKSLISLDMLKIYTSPTLQTSVSTAPVVINGTTYNLFNGSLGTLRYDMSNPLGLNTVMYDDFQHGSGSGDLAIFIPKSVFAGINGTDFLYMYQAWGFNADADLTTQGGFEETFAVVPEVPAFLPLGAVLLAVVGFNWLHRRRKAALETPALAA